MTNSCLKVIKHYTRITKYYILKKKSFKCHLSMSHCNWDTSVTAWYFRSNTWIHLFQEPHKYSISLWFYTFTHSLNSSSSTTVECHQTGLAGFSNKANDFDCLTIFLHTCAYPPTKASCVGGMGSKTLCYKVLDRKKQAGREKKRRPQANNKRICNKKKKNREKLKLEMEGGEGHSDTSSWPQNL